MSKDNELDITTVEINDGSLEEIEDWDIPPEELEIIKERLAFIDDPNRWIIMADHNNCRFYYSLGHARFAREFQEATKFKTEEDAQGFMSCYNLPGYVASCHKDDLVAPRNPISSDADVPVLEDESLMEGVLDTEYYLAADDILGAYFFYDVSNATYGSSPECGTRCATPEIAQACLDGCMEREGKVIKGSEAVKATIGSKDFIEERKSKELLP